MGRGKGVKKTKKTGKGEVSRKGTDQRRKQRKPFVPFKKKRPIGGD